MPDTKTETTGKPGLHSVGHDPGNDAGFSLAVRQALKAPEAVVKEELDPVTAAVVDDKRTDTGLKKVYAIAMLVILGLQLLAMNIIFILVGTGALEYDDTAYLKMFMGGTLAEVFGVVLVITKYLFSKGSDSSGKKQPQGSPLKPTRDTKK